MANAIKKISIQKGYDVSNYVMNCFGGAGGQHACHVADALGISKVLIHPYAGVLSAYGMGLAEVEALEKVTLKKILNRLMKQKNYLIYYHHKQKKILTNKV